MLFGTRFGRHGSHVRSSAFELILVSIAFACVGVASVLLPSSSIPRPPLFLPSSVILLAHPSPSPPQSGA